MTLSPPQIMILVIASVMSLIMLASVYSFSISTHNGPPSMENHLATAVTIQTPLSMSCDDIRNEINSIWNSSGGDGVYPSFGANGMGFQPANQQWQALQFFLELLNYKGCAP